MCLIIIIKINSFFYFLLNLEELIVTYIISSLALQFSIDLIFFIFDLPVQVWTKPHVIRLKNRNEHRNNWNCCN